MMIPLLPALNRNSKAVRHPLQSHKAAGIKAPTTPIFHISEKNPPRILQKNQKQIYDISPQNRNLCRKKEAKAAKPDASRPYFFLNPEIRLIQSFSLQKKSIALIHNRLLWRSRAESHRFSRFCRPVPDCSATRPLTGGKNTKK